MPTQPDAARDRPLDEAAHDVAPDARAHGIVVDEYLPLVRQLARRFANRGEAIEDLEQVASIGLLKAINGFDASRGFEFPAYAHQMIVGELKHHFRDQGWAIRVPRQIQELYLEMNATVAELTQRLGRSPSVREIATACHRSESDLLEAMEAGAGYRATSLEEPTGRERTVLDRVEAESTAPSSTGLYAELSPHLDRLSVRERAIVRLRFVEELTQSQIAERLGLSQMHVSRLLLARSRRFATPMEGTVALDERPECQGDDLFELTVTEVGGWSHVVVVGELDVTTSSALKQAIDDAPGAHGVILELEEVSFIDSTALGILIGRSGGCAGAAASSGSS